MHQQRLNLSPGELVGVRIATDIAATLDRNARLDGVPFMPEMLQYCGRQFRVYRRADKTCDTVNQTGGRRLHNTVHLENVRCDGSGHGDCQAMCLIFWKEAWLRRAEEPASESTGSGQADKSDELRIRDAACRDSESDEPIYSCQATELPNFTTLLHWWDLRQYLRDLRTGNTSVGRFFSITCLAGFRSLLRLGVGTRLLLRSYNWLQRIRGSQPYPIVEGSRTNTPVHDLGLQPGELVLIKSLAEINETLDGQAKNRGMRFDPEMARYCGETYRVAKRVNKIIDESSGRMLHFSTPGIVLDEVICQSEFSSCRLFCPRSIYSYWREIWLEKIEEKSDTGQVDETSERR